MWSLASLTRSPFPIPAWKETQIIGSKVFANLIVLRYFGAELYLFWNAPIFKYLLFKRNNFRNKFSSDGNFYFIIINPGLVMYSLTVQFHKYHTYGLASGMIVMSQNVRKQIKKMTVDFCARRWSCFTPPRGSKKHLMNFSVQVIAFYIWKNGFYEPTLSR